MSRRAGDGDLEVFSFSFLDVLACSVGALAFILLMILFETRDLVERSLVDEGLQVEDRLRDKVATLESELHVMEVELADSVAEATELAEQISVLDAQQPTELHMILPDSLVASKGMEAFAVGRFEERLFHAEDRRVITCGGGKVVLGSSGTSIDVSDRASFVAAVWLYMEYYDERREQLWLVEAGRNEGACDTVRDVMRAARGVRGKGLRSQREQGPPANAVADARGVGVDTNNDGVIDVRYEGTPGETTWTRKLVDRGGGDGVFEEAYLDYDPVSERWLQKQVDTDGDGFRDVVLYDTNPTDDDWEVFRVFPSPSPSASGTDPWGALYEDINGNGRFDKKVVLRSGDRHEGQFLGFDATKRRWSRYLIGGDAQWAALAGDGSF